MIAKISIYIKNVQGVVLVKEAWIVISVVAYVV